MSRKIAVLIGMLVIYTSTVFAEESNHAVRRDNVPVVQISMANMVTFKCGEGNLVVDLETGEATFDGCNPSKASKAIWEGLKIFFDQYKKDMCSKEGQ